MIAVDTDLNIMGVQMSLTQTQQDDRIRFKTQIDYGEWVAAPLVMFKEPDNLPKIWIPMGLSYSKISSFCQRL